MPKVKSQKSKAKSISKKLKVYLLTCSIIFCGLILSLDCFAQQNDDLELTLDIASGTIPTPKIFKPNLDLSGRGYHPEITWPQNLASREALEAWGKDIGFNGLYRIQFNLWEIAQLAKDAGAQGRLLENYETLIKNINDAGGIVILDIFGTPAGMGMVLDKKSSPLDSAGFKKLIKGIVKDFSCEKKYNIWYEVWSAPDSEDFFLGRQQDYLNLYKEVGEVIKELEAKYKINIPVGAPSASSWFGAVGGNTVLTPEDSLIYALIKFCYRNRLPLDFITWHGFSTGPKVEKEITIYDKNAVNLVRDWLSYFNFDKNTPLIVDEWNYDRDVNLLPERKEKSHIAASYIPARLKNMHEVGLDNQVYYCLEDFQGNKEGVTRNVGLLYLTSKHHSYPKVSYNVFRMLKELGKEMFPLKFNDEFAGMLATRTKEGLAIMIYNYIDPEIVENSLAAVIAGLSAAESKFLLGITRSGQLQRIVSEDEAVGSLLTTHRVKALLKNTEGLFNRAERFKTSPRKLKLNLKNIKGDYLYRLFTIDASCSLDCEFKPSIEKELTAQNSYQEELSLQPYSVNLIILKKKPDPPAEPPAGPPEIKEPSQAAEPPQAGAVPLEAPVAKETPKNDNAAGK